MGNTRLKLVAGRSALRGQMLCVSVAIQGPGWTRLAVLKIDIRDLPLRDICVMAAHLSEHTPEPEPDDPLPLDWS